MSRRIGLQKVKLRLFDALERAIRRNSNLGPGMFFESQRFPWVAQVEAGAPLIRNELDAVLKFRDSIPSFNDISVEQLKITDDARWKTFFLYIYGHKLRHNCELCPETERILRLIPGMSTAFFSILLPQKKIPLHRGPYCGVLRYHLGLLIPSPPDACGISVGGEEAHWQEGKSLIFDDTFMHSAWNFSDDLRVILFVDFARPLPFPLSIVNALYIRGVSLTPFVRGVARKQLTWDKILQEAYQRADM